MKVLWICALPRLVQDLCLEGKNYGSRHAGSWILGHLHPPSDVELHIACPSVKTRKKISFEYRGAHFHLIPCIPGRLQTGYLLDPIWFSPFIRALKPDVVHGWGTESSHSMLAQRYAPERCVVQVQGLINDYLDFLPKNLAWKFVAFRERQSLKKAHTVFVESGFSGDITRPYCGTQTHIVQVDHPLRSDFLSAKPGSGDEKGILFIGALCSRKGYLDAVKAFAQSGESAWTLRMVGDGSSEEVAELERLLETLPEHLKIERYPKVGTEEIIALMMQSSVFLLPTYRDTGPTALKEALSMGLWPVCYDNSGPREYIGRFKYGSSCDTGNVEALGALLGQVLEDRPWMQAGVRDKVIETVRNELCAETIWKQLKEHYCRIIDG